MRLNTKNCEIFNKNRYGARHVDMYGTHRYEFRAKRDKRSVLSIMPHMIEIRQLAASDAEKISIHNQLCPATTIREFPVYRIF